MNGQGECGGYAHRQFWKHKEDSACRQRNCEEDTHQRRAATAATSQHTACPTSFFFDYLQPVVLSPNRSTGEYADGIELISAVSWSVYSCLALRFSSVRNAWWARSARVWNSRLVWDNTSQPNLHGCRINALSGRFCVALNNN